MAKERIAERSEEESSSQQGSARGRGASRASGRNRSSKKGRGRSLVALLLLGFVLVASAVIWRRTYGITLATALNDLERQRSQLESERARLAGVIRDESSRTRLVRIVEQRGMHVPNDQQVRILPR